MRNKIFRTFSFIAYLAMAAFSTNASAVVVIDFGTGILPSGTSGGTIVDAAGDGSQIIGTDIFIGAMNVQGTGTTADNGYLASALLNFDTAADTITIFGSVAGLGIGVGSPVTLLSGSFSDWSLAPAGPNQFFVASGPDVKNVELLNVLGIDPNLQFEFFGFSIESKNGVVISTDIVNTAVPVPAAVWLFGSGLIGLVGVARRRA